MNRSVLANEYRNIIRVLVRGGKGSLQEIRSIRHGMVGGDAVSATSQVHTLNVFLASGVEYHRLIRLYAPLNELSSRDRVARTANHVGLSVPL